MITPDVGRCRLVVTVSAAHQQLTGSGTALARSGVVLKSNDSENNSRRLDASAMMLRDAGPI